jgi:hypothetical protein
VFALLLVCQLLHMHLGRCQAHYSRRPRRACLNALARDSTWCCSARIAETFWRIMRQLLHLHSWGLVHTVASNNAPSSAELEREPFDNKLETHLRQATKMSSKEEAFWYMMCARTDCLELIVKLALLVFEQHGKPPSCCLAETCSPLELEGSATRANLNMPQLAVCALSLLNLWAVILLLKRTVCAPIACCGDCLLSVWC